MNQLEYVPGIGGQSVQLDGPTSFVGIAENLRSREWEYDLGYRDLVSATRPAREVDVTFNADYQTADELRRVADADVTARTPGVFVAQKEWRQRGYILASQPNDIHYGRLSTELKIALLDGAWWRLVDKNFMPEDTTPTYRSATGKSVTTVEAANVPLHALTVDGESVQDGTPTPSNPVDVQVVDGGNLIKRPYKANTPYTNAGVTWTVQDDGTITANGTATATSVFVLNNAEMFGEHEQGTYTINGAPPNTGCRVRLQYDNGSGGLSTVDSNAGSSSTFTTNTTLKIASGNNNLFCFIESGQTVNNVVFKPQIEHGSTATPYVPYGSIGIVIGDTATPIDLQGNVLASLPDGTHDTVTVDGAGHCVLTKNVGVATLSSDLTVNSFSTIGTYSRAIFRNACSPQSKTNASNGYCSHSPFFGGWAQDAQHVYTDGTSVVGTAIASTVEQLKSLYLDAKVYYPLATPTTIDLGYIEMPNVFDGAVVSVTAEVTPTITAEWQTSPDIYLDYPHNYPYDYQKTSSTESIMPSVLTPSDVRLVIYGPAVNPYVIVGDNRYQVNATVPSGGYLTVDGRDKSIVLTLADGTVQNVFSSGVRGGGAGGGSYIFEQIPAGESEVTYDGSFGFDLGWYEEEGEPPWNQS